MKKTVLLSIVFFLYIQPAVSQELPTIIPPSPTAFELGKYGQIPVGMFSGTTNLSIPLYNFKAGNLSVPISLSYNSNGIKVDQLSSNVGLGWSLNAGGVITRIVKDEADGENPTIFPEEDIHQAGVNSPMALDYFYLGGQESIDTETDMFMYNFSGNSGKFVLDKNGEVVLVPLKNISIYGHYENGKTGFKAITPDGITYIFLDEELSITRSYGSGHDVPSLPVVTSWYLTKIIHPDGDVVNFTYENSNYHYDMSKSEFLKVATPTYQNSCPNGGGGTGAGYTISPVTTTMLRVVGKRLIEINSNNPKTGKILLESDINHPDTLVSMDYKLVSGLSIMDENSSLAEKIDLNYITTSNGRAFLQSVSFLDPDKKYTMDYIDPHSLVSRLSTAQDHWGYFNGKTSNTRYFPNPHNLEFMPLELSYWDLGADKAIDPTFAKKGLLKRVTYPTKGFTDFEYESNSFFSEQVNNPNPSTLNVSANTGDVEIGSEYAVTGATALIPYTHRAEFYVGVTFNDYECDSDFDTGHSNAQITFTDERGNNANIFIQSPSGFTNIGTSLTQFDDTPTSHYFVDLIEGHTYIVKVKPMFACVSAGVNLIYHDQEPYTVNTNILSGGMRIHTVKSYISDNSISEITRYYYGKKETLEQSSGERGKTAYYLSKQTNRIPCVGCLYVDNYYTILNSSSLRPLFNSSSNSTTYYNFVTVSLGGDNFENGGEENEFIIHNDYQGNPLKGDPIESSTWVNAGWSNGMLKRNTVFKKGESNDFVTLKETIKNYVADNRYFKKVYGYTIQKKFEIPCTGDVTYDCTTSDLNRVYEYNFCTTNHRHIYLIGGLRFDGVNGMVCIASGSDMQVYVRRHPCYGGQVGDIITRPNYLENLDIMEYSTNSYWYYLNQSIEKIFDENGENSIETTTNYFYDNLNHLQPTRVVTTNSKGEVLKQETSYAHERNDTRLINENRIAVPLKQVAYKDTTKLSEQSTTYNDFNGNYLPETIQTSKGSDSLETRITYHDYDAYGNPLELSKADGTHFVYIWGYKHTQPIAKIENASYENLTTAQNTAINNAKLASNNDTDEATEAILRTKLNILRGAFPESQVTTYTYDPLIGITSVTDPRGDTIYYEYDDFNRLEHLKDKDGNILSQNKYNYKN